MMNTLQIIRFSVLVFILSLSLKMYPQDAPVVYSFEEIDSLQQTTDKDVVVFIHTDWCKFCRAMLNTTFKDERIRTLLDEKFLFVDFDAEARDNIRFGGHTFTYKPTGRNTGVNELAEQLAGIDGEVAFPTLAILNPDYEVIFRYNSFLTADDLEKVLKAVLEKS